MKKIIWVLLGLESGRTAEMDSFTSSKDTMPCPFCSLQIMANCKTNCHHEVTAKHREQTPPPHPQPPQPTQPSVWAACFSLTLPLLSSRSLDVGRARPLLSCGEIQAMGTFILLHARLNHSQDQRGRCSPATLALQRLLPALWHRREAQVLAVIIRIWNQVCLSEDVCRMIVNVLDYNSISLKLVGNLFCYSNSSLGSGSNLNPCQTIVCFLELWHFPLK